MIEVLQPAVEQEPYGIQIRTNTHLVGLVRAALSPSIQTSASMESAVDGAVVASRGGVSPSITAANVVLLAALQRARARMKRQVMRIRAIQCINSGI